MSLQVNVACAVTGPRGRLLLFWGCGERAPAGQPVILDFAKLARGEVPPGLYAEGLNLPGEWRFTKQAAWRCASSGLSDCTIGPDCRC